MIYHCVRYSTMSNASTLVVYFLIHYLWIALILYLFSSDSCRRNEDAENTSIRLDLKYIGRKEENLTQIRTNPPSPQCFSAKRGVTNAALTPTAFKPRTQVHTPCIHSHYWNIIVFIHFISIWPIHIILFTQLMPYLQSYLIKNSNGQ